MTGSTFSAENPQRAGAQPDTTVTVRYIVNDVPAGVEFYTTQLGFTIALDARPGFRLVILPPRSHACTPPALASATTS